MKRRPGVATGGRRASTPLNPRVRLFAVIIPALAVVLLAAWSRVLPAGFDRVGILPLVFLLATTGSLLFPLQLGPRQKTSVAAAPEFAALLLFGPTVALAVVGAAAAAANLAQMRLGKRAVWDVAFNAGQITLAVGLAGVALGRVADRPLPFDPRLDNATDVAALVAAAATMYVVNTCAVAAMVGLQRRTSPARVWLAARRADVVQAIGLYMLGTAIALVVRATPWMLVAFAVPLTLVYQSLRQAQRSLGESETRRALELDLARAEKLKALGQLAAGVAHDVNNQLGAILSSAELLRDAVESGSGQRADVLDHLSHLERAAEDAAKIVRRVQLFARRADDGPTSRAPVCVGDLLDDVVAFTRPRWRDEAQAAGRRITIRVRRDAAPMVVADPGELREALVNLVHNAIDAMPAGGVITLTATEEPVVDGTREAVLAVRDAGVGMDEQTRAHLFEPFYTTKPVGQGTGMGLAMVHGIVERLHGSIDVQSAPGAGTTVAIRLPSAGSPADKAPAQRDERPRRISSRRVLVVEDEDGLRRVVIRLLERDGHACVAVASAEAALELLDRGRGAFDVVLTDVGLPGASGWQLAQHVTARAPDARVIVATGWAAAISDDQLASAGLTRSQLVAKPYRAADLRRAIDRLFPSLVAPSDREEPNDSTAKEAAGPSPSDIAGERRTHAAGRAR